MNHFASDSGIPRVSHFDVWYYMNIIRDRNVLKLRQTNVKVLTEQLRASETRFSVGEITRTDVAQSRARLALSRSQLSGAEANLAASVANYLRIIGHRPGTLRFPQLLKATPKSLRDPWPWRCPSGSTLRYWRRHSMRRRQRTISISWPANCCPNSRLNAQYSFNFIGNGGVLDAGTAGGGGTGLGGDGGGSKDTWNDKATIFGQVTVPIYEGGLTYSRVREAKQLASQMQL